MFNLEDNFDGVSGFLGCVLGLREFQSNEADQMKIEDKKKGQIYSKLLKGVMRPDFQKSAKKSIFD